MSDQTVAPHRALFATAGVLLVAAGLVMSGWPLVLGGLICLVLAAAHL
ncbi:MAG: hypothetical protein ACTHK6_09145 [Solirubrobacterales bacterium]